jgi:WD40 repeat protein
MKIKKQFPDHAACVVALAAVILLAGCGKNSKQESGGAPTLKGAASIAEPHFVAGGGTGNIAIACDGTIRSLHVAGSRVTSAELPPEDYLAVWFDPAGTGSRFIVRTDQGPVLLEGGQARALPGWPAGISAVAASFSPDGRLLAAAPSVAGDASLIFWKLPLNPLLTIPSGDLGVVSLMTWSGDGRSLLVTDRNNRLAIFRPPKKKAVFTQEVDLGSEGRITAIDLSTDGDWYVMAANAIVIRAWQLPFMNAQLKAWGRVEKLFFAGDVAEVVTIDETNAAIHWLVNYGKVHADTTLTLEEPVALGVPAGGNHFYSLGRDGRVRAYRSGDFTPLGEAEGVMCGVTAAAGDSVGAALNDSTAR